MKQGAAATLNRQERIPLNRVKRDPIKDFRPPADIPDDQLWTAKAVEERLIEAARLIERTAGRVAPKRYGSSMPEYMHDWGDLLGQAEAGNMFEGGNQIRIGASQAAMTRVEEAMVWPMRYLEDYDGPRRVLRLFLWCKVRRVPFNFACKKRGWSRTTAWRARDKALTLISIGLIMGRVPMVHAREGFDARDQDEADEER